MAEKQTLTAEQEASRKKKGDAGAGQFGEHTRRDPDVAIEHKTQTKTLSLTGPGATLVSFPATDERDAEVLTIREARERLNIPADESDEAVFKTVALLGAEYSLVSKNTFEDPGADANIDTSSWEEPADGVPWTPHAFAWRGEGDLADTVFVRAGGIFKPEDYGYEHATRAFENIIFDYARSWGDGNGDEVEDTGEGYALWADASFTDDEFWPELVEKRLQQQLSRMNPVNQLDMVRRTGVVISDADLIAAADVKDPKIVAYAAQSGRVPTDAEVVAILAAYKARSPLQNGYVPQGRSDDFVQFPKDVDDGTRDRVLGALNKWYLARRPAN